MAQFPELPIITLEPERMSKQEKYGSFYYLSIFGLFVVIGLVGWFTWSAWSLRGIWSNVYRLHDRNLGERERIAAARALCHETRYADSQALELCLQTTIPTPARYLLAERLRADSVATDPVGYVHRLSPSGGLPNWLRGLLARPPAYAAGEGVPIPRRAVAELVRDTNPIVSIWASTASLLADHQDPEARIRLNRLSQSTERSAAVASILLRAVDAGPTDRRLLLDQATRELRAAIPEAAKLD